MAQVELVGVDLLAARWSLCLLILKELIQRTEQMIPMPHCPDYPADTNTSAHTPPERVPADQLHGWLTELVLSRFG